MIKYLFALAFICGACNQSVKNDDLLCQWVDPFIGTDGPGNTYPGATLPFGMVQLSPDNGRSGWDWISGYFYPDTVIAGFSHLHLSGTGAGDLYDISFFSYTGDPLQAAPGELGPGKTPYSRFSHDRESASPGYYSVELDDYQIHVELSTTKRSGLQKYTYKQAAEATIHLNLGYARNWDWVIDAEIEVINDSTIAGYRKSSGWAKDQRVFFYSIFSKPFQEVKIYDNDSLITNHSDGKKLLAKFNYQVIAGESILIKTGISSVSVENAKHNLNAEQRGFDFDKVKDEAAKAWETELSKIRIQTDPDNMTQFYSAMYHSMLGPTLFSDVNGEYKGPDSKIHAANDYDRYATFSLWDTYRAEHPLATILHPNRTVDFINSMLSHFDETGLLPVWELLGNETDMMMGYHAVPVIADAILKNIQGFSHTKAYAAMKVSAMQDKNGLKEYKELGYVPYETRSWNVSLTLEYAYDDWCIAQVAKKLGLEDEFSYYSKRAENFKNHFDPETGFMRARSKTGEYRVPFNPNSYSPEDYCEANAWHYSWYVPHQVDELISLHGGNKNFIDGLQLMFSTEQEVSESTVWISGYFGQYVHGNEPSHHVPYLFSQAGRPDLTEYWVRKIIDEQYTTTPDGLCGNEDYGQMSAWYVFSSLGFYPLNPAGGEYIIGSPQVEEAVINLGNDKKFTIKTINQSAENIHVKSITLNGEIFSRNFITHQTILEGGELIFEMEK